MAETITKGDEVRTISVADAPWADVETVFGTRGDPARCWCQYFKLSGAGWDSSTREQCRSELEARVAASAPPPGVIAYSSDEPVGWCAVEPRPNYARLRNAGRPGEQRGPRRPLGMGGHLLRRAHRLPPARRRRRLLDAAVEHARAHGARVVEGYPVDTAAKQSSSASLYHGTLSLFLAAGFELADRPTPHRAFVRLTL